MKNKLILLSKKTAMLLLCTALGLTAFGKQKVAVYVTGNDNAPENKIVGAKMVSAIVNDGFYEAVERTSSFMAQLQKEQKYQSSGAVSDDDISKLGAQFGVNFVCIVDITPVGRSYFMAARLVNVETAAIDATADATCETFRDINAITASATQLAAALLNISIETSPTATKKNVQRSTGGASVSPFRRCGCEVKIEDEHSAGSENKFIWSLRLCPEGWRLPTRRELQCMCDNKDKIRNFTESSTHYWTSEEIDEEEAWGVTFNDCELEKRDKFNDGYVRCVRDFK